MRYSWRVATTKRSGKKAANGSVSQQISAKSAALADWRGETFEKLRALIHEADPDIVEELKWMGTPVFSHDGIVCTGEVYKQVVKLTFAKGAFVKDPAKLFNSSLEGNLRRAIDFREGEKINARALKALITAAVELNVSGKKPAPAKKSAPAKKGAPPKKSAVKKSARVKPSAPARKTASKRAAR